MLLFWFWRAFFFVFLICARSFFFFPLWNYIWTLFFCVCRIWKDWPFGCQGCTSKGWCWARCSQRPFHYHWLHGKRKTFSFDFTMCSIPCSIILLALANNVLCLFYCCGRNTCSNMTPFMASGSILMSRWRTQRPFSLVRSQSLSLESGM